MKQTDDAPACGPFPTVEEIHQMAGTEGRDVGAEVKS
jgi:hypothetical protein